MPCDLTLDREYWDLAPDDVSIHITRTGFHDGGLTLEFVRGVSDLGEARVRDAQPVQDRARGHRVRLHLGFVHQGLAGEATIRDTMLANGAPSAVTTSGAMLEALRHLGVRRVGLGTPYALEIAEFLPPFVRDAGFEPVSLANLELPDVMDDIAADAVRELAALAYRPEAEAIFLACTGVPTIGLLAELSRRYGVPVLSANKVTMWSALRAAGLPDAVSLHRPQAVPAACRRPIRAPARPPRRRALSAAAVTGAILDSTGSAGAPACPKPSGSTSRAVYNIGAPVARLTVRGSAPIISRAQVSSAVCSCAPT